MSCPIQGRIREQRIGADFEDLRGKIRNEVGIHSPGVADCYRYFGLSSVR